jgi:hypothetical protein
MAPHIERILDMARWAPSGDNTQPWRFEILAENHLCVLGYDTRSHCVYDLDGHASQIAHGALLETLAIAATVEGLSTEIQLLAESHETAPVYDVWFIPRNQLAKDPLADMIKRRSVQRRAMSTRPLRGLDKVSLAASVPGYHLVWFESLGRRWKLARFMAANAKNRLTMPEAYPTHRDVIEWNARYSEDRIPESAIGVDPITAKLMQWALGSWSRIELLNTWLAGTLMPRIQLDLLPGLRCAAHFALVAEHPLSSIDDYVLAGRALQRLWLTATSLGLWMQPEMTPVIFSRYVREGRPFTQVDSINARARRLAKRMESWLGLEGARQTVFMGRIGYGPEPWSRSLRKPLDRLMVGQAQSPGPG